MTDRPMSETMAMLRADFVELKGRCQQAEDDLAKAGKDETEAEYAYAKKVATHRTIHLDAKMSRNAANDRARDSAVEEAHAVKLASSAVRNAENVIRLLNHQLDTVQALGHFANREIKLEMAG